MASTSAESQRIDTSNLPYERRFTHWVDSVNNLFYRHEIKSSKTDKFMGQVSWRDTGSLRLFDHHSDPVIARRSRSQISQDTEYKYLLCYPLDGPVTLQQSGRKTTLTAGECALFGTSDPYVYLQPQKTQLKILLLPEKLLTERCSTAPDLTVTSFNAQQGMWALLSDFIGSVYRRAVSLTPNENEQVSNQLLDLLALTLVSLPGDTPLFESSVRVAHRQRITTFIERNYSNPELTVEGIAVALGLSPRYLRELLQEADQTTSGVIRNRRIWAAKSMLKDPAARNLSISEIGWRCGYMDPDYFGRVFKKISNLSPNEYRRSKFNKNQD